MKKILCVMLAVMTLTLCIAPALAINIRGVNPGDTLYVKTSGGTLNLRAEPYAKADKLAKIPYGHSVVALDKYENGYLYVSYNSGKKHYEGWVDIKYLDASKPQPKPTSKPDPKPTAKPDPEKETVASLNFRSYKLIPEGTTYIVASKPNRSGGFVNLRWVPSMDSAIIERMYAGEQMIVISEGSKWLQVQCADGYVGFIMKNFVTTVYYGDTETWEASQGDGVGAEGVIPQPAQ